MKMPYTKKVLVTSCNQSHGAPKVRVNTSKNTELLNPARQIPHSTIVTASRKSSARHFRWRWVSRTSRLGLFITEVSEVEWLPGGSSFRGAAQRRTRNPYSEARVHGSRA